MFLGHNSQSCRLCASQNTARNVGDFSNWVWGVDDGTHEYTEVTDRPSSISGHISDARRTD
eukprot:4043818-Amphidinium_carterae.1